MNNFYSNELIEEIRNNNPIEDVISEYVKLENKGKYLFGLCPFHKEKTPSFSVTPSKQIYYCYSCGKGGNVFQFIMDIENLTFVDTLKFLAKRARIELPEGDNTEEKEKILEKKEILNINKETAKFYFETLNNNNGKIAYEYLQARGIKKNTLKKFGLGYSPNEWDLLYKYLLKKGFELKHILNSGLIIKRSNGTCHDRFRNRIMFPIFDVWNNIIGFGGRVIDNSLPKYMNSPESIVYNKRKNLYSLNFAKNAGRKRIIVVEGYMDVISLHQSGITNVVASLGTALTENQGRLLKKYADEIIFAYDSDAAGQAATLRGLDIVNKTASNIKVLLIPEGKDPDEFVKKHGAKEFEKLIENSLSFVEYKIKILKDQNNTNTMEGKVKFLNKTANLLAELDNTVEKEIYVKKLAKDYEISEQAILTEIYKKSKPKTTLKSTTWNTEFKNLNEYKNNKDKFVSLDYYEKLILIILCESNNLYNYVNSLLTYEDYIINTEIAKLVYERLKSNYGITIAEIFNTIDQKSANEFAKIIQNTANFEDNKQAVVDLIKKIKILKLEIRQLEIIDTINKTSIEEDIKNLKQELNSIIIKKKKL